MIVSNIQLLVDSGQRMTVAQQRKVNIGVIKMVDVSHHVPSLTVSKQKSLVNVTLDVIVSNIQLLGESGSS